MYIKTQCLSKRPCAFTLLLSVIRKDHEMKAICVVVGVKECMASPESFPFTDKHAAASVNKIHGGKKNETHLIVIKDFFPSTSRDQIKSVRVRCRVASSSGA